MKNDANIVALRQPGSVDDPLTEIARDGARRMLAAALRVEADAFVAQHAEATFPDGRHSVVRHGYGPERSIRTGIGALDVQRPKVRDRATDVPAGQKIRFTSSILPKRARRSCSLDALLPVLYLRGIATGNFQEALAAIMGKDAPNLTPGGVSQLTGEWQQEHDRWQRRDLSARRYVCIRADGVCLQAPMEPQAGCILALPGATAEGRKEFAGFQVGVRESTQIWRELLVDINARAVSRWRPDRPRRRGHGLLEGARGGLSGHAPPEVPGPQDGQHPEQVLQIHAVGGEGQPARDLAG